MFTSGDQDNSDGHSPPREARIYESYGMRNYRVFGGGSNDNGDEDEEIQLEQVH